MKNLTILSVLVLIMCLFAADHAEAQRRYKSKRARSKRYSGYRGGRVQDVAYLKRYTTAGFSVNAMNYFGDIAPAPTKFSTDIQLTRAGFGLTLSRKLTGRTFVRGGLNWGRITGDDFKTGDPDDVSGVTRYKRNLSFRNDIIELNVGLEIDFLPNFGSSISRFRVTPYLYLGMAVLYSNPQGLVPQTDAQGNELAEAGTWVGLRSLGTEGQNIDTLGVSGYGPITFAIPVGLGLKFRLHDNWDLNFEVGVRQTFTDYLDDVSTTYIDPGYFGDDNLARAMADRSTETIAAVAKEPRREDVFTVRSRVSEVDGRSYNHVAGYGEPDQIRGNPGDNDIYVVTQLRIVYIFSTTFIRRGKFR